MKRYKFHTKKNHVEIELNVQTLEEMKGSIKQQATKFKNWLHSPKKKQHKKLIEIEIETDKTHKKWGI